MKLRNLLLVLGLVAFIFASCNKVEDSLKDDEDSSDLTTEDPTVLYDDKTSDISELEDEPEEDIIEIPDEEKLTDESTRQKRWYIVGGSFHEYQNALELYNGLVKRGYSNSQILDPVNKFNRVVISSFDDEQKARKELERLRKMKNDDTIWLLEGK